jgi:hypothetical protein
MITGAYPSERRRKICALFSHLVWLVLKQLSAWGNCREKGLNHNKKMPFSSLSLHTPGVPDRGCEATPPAPPPPPGCCWVADAAAAKAWWWWYGENGTPPTRPPAPAATAPATPPAVAPVARPPWTTLKSGWWALTRPWGVGINWKRKYSHYIMLVSPPPPN